jgi:hypothetical protein
MKVRAVRVALTQEKPGAAAAKPATRRGPALTGR